MVGNGRVPTFPLLRRKEGRKSRELTGSLLPFLLQGAPGLAGKNGTDGQKVSTPSLGVAAVPME